MTNGIEIIMVAYNEAESIEKVMRDFYEAVSPYGNVQITVAEDGSTDGTRQILRRLEKELPVRLVLADDRRGYTRAVNDAIKVATNDTILFMDADGQYFPEDFSSLFALWRTGDNDMVIGEKVLLRHDPLHRKFFSWIHNVFVRLLFNVPFHDMNCSYRLIKKEIAQRIAPQCQLLPYSYWTEFTVRAYSMGYKVVGVPVNHRGRLSGTSRIYPTKKLLAITLEQLKGLCALHKEIFSGHPKRHL